MKRSFILGMLASAAMVLSAPASASLSTFGSWTGNVDYSTDGFGSLSNSGTISASAPIGSTVLAAYLYTTVNFNQSHAGVGATLNGSTVTFGAPSVNASAGFLSSARADVTSIVSSVINGGAGGVYNFDLTELSSSQDGEALVVIFKNNSLPVSSIGVLDGFSAVTGDTTSVNFAEALNPAAPGFSAEMSLGISFSCCSQKSSVKVNGTTITTNAGNNDDGDLVANGSLITVGGYDDPFSVLNPSYADDHERYNLIPYITAGDTSIKIDTLNPSADDNIFLLVAKTSGVAGFNEPPVPEPETWALLVAGLAVAGALRQRRKA
jgi:hypothetical protein